MKQVASPSREPEPQQDDCARQFEIWWTSEEPVHRELESRERLLLPWPDARRNSGERTLHRKSVGCVGLGFNWRHVCSYTDFRLVVLFL